MTAAAPGHEAPGGTPGGEAPDDRGLGVRIARVAGIPVYLAPSWFVIAVVITVIVAAPLLRTRPLVGLAVGVVQALALLVCVLVHEAAHAVVARGFGMPVVRIVATVWGGHTSMESVRTTPGRMALVAAAGPAANAVFALLAWAALPGVTGDVGNRLLYGLVIINGSLAVLNILPGMPLDGGQVLECLVWKATGDRNRGSVVAGWSGRVLTVLLVLWFFVRPVAQGQTVGFGLLWVLVIASVLWSGATESIRRGHALGKLERIRVEDVAERVVVLPPTSPIGMALEHPDIVLTTDERGVPCLVFGGADQGLHPDMDRRAPITAAVSRLPDANLVAAGPQDGVTAVVAAMQQTGVATVVLTAGGRPWGLTSAERINAAAEGPRARS